MSSARVPRFTMAGTIVSSFVLFLLLSITIIGVVALPDLIPVMIRSIDHEAITDGLPHKDFPFLRGPREVRDGSILLPIASMICFVGIGLYHRPVRRLLAGRRRKMSSSEGLRLLAKRRLLASARATAVMMFLGLTFINAFLLTRLAPETRQMLPLGPSGLKIVPLGILIQVLITLFVFYRQNHRVKTVYYHHVFDSEELAKRPARMSRSSIKSQIWGANILTTLFPLVLVLLYFYVFISAQDTAALTRDQVTTLLGRYAPILEQSGLSETFFNEIMPSSEFPFGRVLFFNVVDTWIMIVSLCVGIAVTITYSYLIAKWSIHDIIMPLKKLRENIRKTAGGDFSTTTPVLNNDELGEVTENFNRMLESLRRTDALRTAKDVAEAANRAKSAFLANMSHELRTPLNAILGFTQLMTRDVNLTPEQQQNLTTINRSGEHLLGLINDVLDMSKIESGRLTVIPESFDLHYLLDGIEEMFAIRASDKGLSLLLERDDDVPRFVEADENKLRQILMNLMSNAVKFTSEGGVSARVGLTMDEDGGHRLHFEVEDTGPGIPDHEKDALFEPFAQTSQGMRSLEGTGLGLPISKRLVELMGGELAVTTTPGKGSLFRFTIAATPADEVGPRKSRPRRVTGMAPDQPTYRILIAEDRETNRQLLVSILRPFNLEVREAANGREAVDMWEEWEPHLIFMDMQMPVMDGHEATKHIKATTRGQATVIIALTASAFEDERNLILSEGCDDFIRKPFREHEIFERIESHLGAMFTYEETARPAKPVKLTREQLQELPAQWREELAAATVRGDMDTMLGLLEQIRADHPSVAEGLSSLAHDYDYHAILGLMQEKETNDGR